MKNIVDRMLEEALHSIEKCDNKQTLEKIKSITLGREGKLTAMMRKLHEIPIEERKDVGAMLNHVKDVLLTKINERKNAIEMTHILSRMQQESADMNLSAPRRISGKMHPLNTCFVEVAEILQHMGLHFVDGSDIESDYYNFTALNIPEHHPARAMQDTFYVKNAKKGTLLRTHTSPVQIHAMKKYGAPCALFSIGRTYRSDYDATHTPMFHQIEIIVVGENINFGNMKWFIDSFLSRFFETSSVHSRLRPGFFPFTEPSGEYDMQYSLDQDNRIVMGKGDRWIELCGCGMIHPNVLRNCDIDTEKYGGFAAGMGLERLASLKYGMNDLRGYFEFSKNWHDTFGRNFYTVS